MDETFGKGERAGRKERRRRREGKAKIIRFIRKKMAMGRIKRRKKKRWT